LTGVVLAVSDELGLDESVIFLQGGARRSWSNQGTPKAASPGRGPRPPRSALTKSSAPTFEA
jgi:hypothetical protein